LIGLKKERFEQWIVDQPLEIKEEHKKHREENQRGYSQAQWAYEDMLPLDQAMDLEEAWLGKNEDSWCFWAHFAEVFEGDKVDDRGLVTHYFPGVVEDAKPICLQCKDCKQGFQNLANDFGKTVESCKTIVAEP
jgi:hypothetical protein